MTPDQFITILISVIALVVAIIFNIIQTAKTTESLRMQIQITRGDVLMNFSNKFFDLVKEGDLYQKIQESSWAYQYWSLISTEFYFYHHGILPVSIFSLWMTDLAEIYSGASGRSIRRSHSEYLNTYSFTYAEMTNFFQRIDTIAISHEHKTARNQEISDFVRKWIAENHRAVLS